MSLGAGTRLGPYQVLGLIGAGGMGEVYRAHDSKLGRDVAIKILPAQLMADQERRARFAREARFLAALNHPNIGAIYGLEDLDGVAALILELVEGPTLAEQLAGGPLPSPDALKIGLQVADALETAHERGIIHRDLKPANIILQRTAADPGRLRAKVLDFGVGKATSLDFDAGRTHSFSPSFEVTVDSEILGSPAYMSPEQARGEPVDNRADIWGFGCLLFEMLSGHPAFGRATAIETIAAVLDVEADWNRLPADVGSSIRMLIRRCLVKDPSNRLHHIADARLEIEDALKQASSTASSAALPIRLPVQTTYVWLRVLLILLGVELLGFLMSATFNRTIGRTGRFGWESPGDWFVWGLRSLVAPAVYTIIIRIVILLLKRAFRELAKTSFLVSPSRRLRRQMTVMSAAVGLNDPLVLGEAISVLGIVALGIVLWRFWDLVNGYWNPVNEMLPYQLAALAPEHVEERVLYMWTFECLVAVLTLSVLYLYRLRARSGITNHAGWPRVAFGVLILAVVLAVLPYRVFFHSRFPEIDVHGNRCYVIAENREEFLVHCPKVRLPRNQIVNKADSDVRLLGVVGSIYEPAP